MGVEKISMCAVVREKRLVAKLTGNESREDEVAHVR